MKVWLNDYLLNDETNRTYLREPIEGLELPGLRTSRGERSGQAGSYIGAQLWDARFVTLNGHIFAQSISEAKQKRREIQAALPLYPTPINVRILDDDGYSYVFVAQLAGSKPFMMPLTQSNHKHIWKLELEACDSVIYDDTAGSALEATVTQAAPGGMYFSATSPWFGHTTYFSSGAANATVDNPSLVPVYPVITITGKTTNPILTNVTTGQVWSLEGYAVPDGSVTVIDMQAHTVTLNDGNVFAYVPLDASWWALVPGVNEIAFSSGAGSDVQEATMTWRPGLMGI